jgi:hypothetical protein
VSAARTVGHHRAALAAASEPGAGIEERAGLPGTGAAARLLCDNCYAGLSPDITVTVTYFACQHYGSHPFGVIRQRTRSDQDYPDLGQLIAWDMHWRRTSILVEEEHGGAGCDVTTASQDGAELIIASLARRYWYGHALQVPWVRTAYPKQTPSGLIAVRSTGRALQVGVQLELPTLAAALLLWPGGRNPTIHFHSAGGSRCGTPPMARSLSVGDPVMRFSAVRT